jgi:hypothetical protein
MARLTDLHRQHALKNLMSYRTNILRKWLANWWKRLTKRPGRRYPSWKNVTWSVKLLVWSCMRPEMSVRSSSNLNKNVSTSSSYYALYLVMWTLWWWVLWDYILLCRFRLICFKLSRAYSPFWINFVDVLLVHFVDVLLEGPSLVTIVKLLVSYCSSWNVAKTIFHRKASN